MAEAPRFTAETNILEALERGELVGKTLKRLGLKCVDARDESCVASAVETLADAARYHNLPLERILSELNALSLPAPPSRPQA
jgi:hypothetical protein